MNLEKVDKFYLVLLVVLVLMALLMIISFKGIFSAFNSAYELDQSSFAKELKIDKEKLNEAYSWVTKKEGILLKIRD